MTRKVLLTGAAGRIGRFFHNAYTDVYDFSLTDIVEPAETKGAPFAQVDLSDFDAVRPLCDGIDTVVHLGADPSMDAPWESLLPNNVVATYNVFESARQAGCRRVVYASSINAVLGYPRDQQVHTSQPFTLSICMARRNAGAKRWPATIRPRTAFPHFVCVSAPYRTAIRNGSTGITSMSRLSRPWRTMPA